LGSESSHSSWVVSDIDLSLVEEFTSAVFEEFLIEIFSTEMGITSSGFDFEDTVINSEDGYIESTTTKIEDKDISLLVITFLFFIKTISDSSGGWFIDDSLNGESSNLTSILGGLSLGVIEISRDGDNSIFDLFVEMRLSDLSHLSEDH